MASSLDEYFGDGDEMLEEDEYIDAWPDGPPDEGLGSRCPVGDVSAASGAGEFTGASVCRWGRQRKRWDGEFWQPGIRLWGCSTSNAG